MANAATSASKRPQGAAGGVIVGDGGLQGRAGNVSFSIGAGTSDPTHANPYELLSASLAACTALTIQQVARRKGVPLAGIEVAVSYTHGANGARGVFESLISLRGELSDDQRAFLMQVASICPVGRTLTLGADIKASENAENLSTSQIPASYEEDLGQLSIPNIDPD
ncbi:MAG: OsmC family peroxiredoxin [Bradyrhizobium sp.]|nr:OsmC family peroxiredoxin [Bradyrhizobium sp.]